MPGTGQCTDDGSMTFRPLARPVLWLSSVGKVRESHWSEATVNRSRGEAKTAESLSQGHLCAFVCFGSGFPTEEGIPLGFVHLA